MVLDRYKLQFASSLNRLTATKNFFSKIMGNARDGRNAEEEAA